jgi:hypothetical protein
MSARLTRRTRIERHAKNHAARRIADALRRREALLQIDSGRIGSSESERCRNGREIAISRITDVR